MYVAVKLIKWRPPVVGRGFDIFGIFDERRGKK
jgi:hypothetical protein